MGLRNSDFANYNNTSSKTVNIIRHSDCYFIPSRICIQGIRVLIYNGDTDMACNFLGDEWFVEELDQTEIADYKAWYSKDGAGVLQVAGYVRQFEGINFVTVKVTSLFSFACEIVNCFMKIPINRWGEVYIYQYGHIWIYNPCLHIYPLIDI